MIAATAKARLWIQSSLAWLLSRRPAHAQTHQNVQSLEDLRPHLIDEIQEFFIAYNRLRGRKFMPLALTGPDKSRELSRPEWTRLRNRTINELS
jgi:inorganic pyrophosphatase